MCPSSYRSSLNVIKVNIALTCKKLFLDTSNLIKKIPIMYTKKIWRDKSQSYSFYWSHHIWISWIYEACRNSHPVKTILSHQVLSKWRTQIRHLLHNLVSTRHYHVCVNYHFTISSLKSIPNLLSQQTSPLHWYINKIRKSPQMPFSHHLIVDV